MAAYDFSNVSSADLLRLEWADEEERKRAANRVNTFAQLMGQRGDWSPTSGSDGVAALTAYSKSRDLEHLQQAQKMMSSALGTPALPYNDPAKFNTWYKTAQIPYRFVKDLRASYKNMSDQFRASEKHPSEIILQKQQIAAGEHAAKMRPGELTLQEQELVVGKPIETKEIKIGNMIVMHRWDQTNKKWIPMVGKDGEIIQAPRQVEGPTAKQQDFDRFIGMVNAARKEAGESPLTKDEENQYFEDYVLSDRVVQQQYEKGVPTDLLQSQIAFGQSIQQITRMLDQLADPEVLIGGIGGVFKGLESVAGQARQLARYVNEDFLFDKEYDFGPAAKAGALHGNIINLAYQLARAAEPGGRLNERDVQRQVDRITGSLQSKRSMARSLMEVHNQTIAAKEIEYGFMKRRNVPGTELEWEDFLIGLGIGELISVQKGGKIVVGYKIGGGKLQPVAMWDVK